MKEYPHILIQEPALVILRTYESGGGGTHPRDDYAAHAGKIFREAQRAIVAANGTPDAAYASRRYFRLELPLGESVWSSTGASAATHLHGTIVGAPSRSVAHVSTTASGASLMLAELGRYSEGIGKSKFAVIESLGSIPVSEKIGSRARAELSDPEAMVTVLALLFSDLSPMERRAIASVLGAWLAARHGAIESTLEADSGPYVRIRARAKDVELAAESFLSLQSIDPIEYVLEYSSVREQSVSERVQVQQQKSPGVAAIFDGGIARDLRLLDGSVIDREEPLGPPYNTEHGTFVASRVVYGDTLRDQLAAGVLVSSTRVLSVCTISHDAVGNRLSASTEDLMRIVRETVERWHGQIRVYNISQNLFPRDPGQDPTVPDDVVSPLAAELDSLARRFRVLFVVSAGNYPRPGVTPPPAGGPYPGYFANADARIVPPGEAVLALTVGSVATIANGGSMAPHGAPSPFTRRGPGFAGFQKPDLVAHGGNCGLLWQSTPDLSVLGVSADKDYLAHGTGTSYAAPLVTRYAAQLFAALPSASPELVRALLIHFAAESTFDAGSVPTEHLLGYGCADGERILRSISSSQAFVYSSALPHREIRRIPFFVPAALLAPRRRQRVRVRATVVWAPETDRTLKAAYCMSNVRCKLVKRDGNGILREVAADDQTAHRYASVRRLEKVFSTRVGPGEWQLIVEHESRWSLRDGALPVAVVVTVEDPANDDAIDVPLAVRAEAPANLRGVLTAPIRLRP